jgi:hypothetical protein
VRQDPRITVTNKGRGEISALGQNSRYNNIQIDAVPTNDSFGLEANGLPALGQPISMDTIEAYDISTADYDVANKRAVGASINAVTKSGTNDFHGSAYYVFRNDKWVRQTDDRDLPFNSFDRQWTAGFTVGGPIVKDRLFFFAGYEEAKTVGVAPTLDAIANGNVTQADIDQITSIAQGYGLVPGDLDTASINLDDKKTLVKLDWNINDDHRASLRFDQTKSTQPILGGFSSRNVSLSSYWYTQERNFRNWALNLYDDWSMNFSTEASLSRSTYSSTPSVLAQQPQIQVKLPTGGAVNLGEEQFRHYNVLDVTTTTGFVAGTWYLDTHKFKLGVDFQRDDYYNLFGRTEFGAYNFNSIADFAAGRYSSFNLYRPTNGDINSVAANVTLDQIGYFASDSWQASDKLAVEYGLRYDVPRTDDRPPLNTAIGPAFSSQEPSLTRYNNQGSLDGNGVLEPRFSFNYAFDTKLHTQLRGGIGLFEGTTPGVWVENPFANNGLTIQTFSAFGSAPGAFNPDPYTQQPPGTAAPKQQVDLIDPEFRLPTVWKASLAFDRELPWWGVIASAEFQHIRVRDGIQYLDLNLGAPNATLPDGRNSYWVSTDPTFFSNPSSPKDPANPSRDVRRANSDQRFSNVTFLTNTGKGASNTLTLALRKPFSEEWYGSVAATFGHSTEVNPGTSSQATSNYSSRATYNPNEDVAARSNYDISKRLTASLTWQHAFFGGYRTTVSGFYDAHPGQPYSYVFGNDANGDGISNNDLFYVPTGPGDVQFTNSTTAAQQQQFFDYINSNPYLSEHKGEVVSRNGATSPWVNQFDLSFSQELPAFIPQTKAEVRLDIFNVGNLLNRKWGQVDAPSFASAGGYTLDVANFAGVDPVTGQYIYSLSTVNNNYAPEGYNRNRDDDLQSRWSAQVTLRIKF